MSSDIVIVDLGTGNLRSVSKALIHVGHGARVCISREPATIAAAARLVLPGQGAIGTWFNQLNADIKLRDAVLGRLKRGPVFGICLGLEALYARSEENGGTDGLGILAGTVRHFDGDGNSDGDDGDRDRDADGNVHDRHPQLKIPHMGWNRVRHTRAHPLWDGVADGARFYFVHSYYVDSDGDETVGECDYGGIFTAAAAHNNLFATQFHPEKSQDAGLRLLKNFVNWNGA